MKRTRNDFSGKNKSGRGSFYVAVWTAAVCFLAVGGVYYSTTRQTGEQERQKQAQQNQPAATAAQDGAVSAWVGDGEEGQEESRAASAFVKPKEKDTSKKKSSKKETAGKASEQKQEKEQKAEVTQKPAQPTTADQSELSFNEEKGLIWPVKGDVLMKFSEKNTIYYKTLAQYRSNPAIEISANEGTKVKAAAAGKVIDISQKEETGTTLTTSIGGDYTVIYGQLKDVSVAKGDTIKVGDVIGKVAAPTKYFTEEGGNLYFQVMQNNKAVDPLLLLQ